MGPVYRNGYGGEKGNMGGGIQESTLVCITYYLIYITQRRQEIYDCTAYLGANDGGG